MKYMGWTPQALGYRAALERHIEAVLALMAEEVDGTSMRDA
jgi:hypothetical protein